MSKPVVHGTMAVGALVLLWFATVTVWLSIHPAYALAAFTTDGFRVHVALAGAVLRYAPYDPNGTSDQDQPLLHVACAGFGLEGARRENSIRAIRVLAAKGAKINSRDNGLTPLHEAILYYGADGDIALIRTLLELGADPSARLIRPGRRENGLSAVEYAELLGETGRTDMRPIIDLLRGSVR